jgi:hypothetical protein
VLARLAAALHQRQFELDGLTLGGLGTRPETVALLSVDDEGITVAVFGAHLQGQPLNGQLRAWGATLVGPCVTTPVYRMHLLPGTRDISAYGDWRGFLSRELSRELAGARVRAADS